MSTVRVYYGPGFTMIHRLPFNHISVMQSTHHITAITSRGDWCQLLHAYTSMEWS